MDACATLYMVFRAYYKTAYQLTLQTAAGSEAKTLVAFRPDLLSFLTTAFTNNDRTPNII